MIVSSILYQVGGLEILNDEYEMDLKIFHIIDLFMSLSSQIRIISFFYFFFYFFWIHGWTNTSSEIRRKTLSLQAPILKTFGMRPPKREKNERPPSKGKRLGSSRGFCSGIPQMRSRRIYMDIQIIDEQRKRISITQQGKAPTPPPPNYARIQRPSGRTTRKGYPPMHEERAFP